VYICITPAGYFLLLNGVYGRFLSEGDATSSGRFVVCLLSQSKPAILPLHLTQPHPDRKRDACL